MYTISIHAPRAGSDQGCNERPFCVFASTLPVRGATYVYLEFKQLVRFQSTLPVRGATKDMAYNNAETAISIHAPRAGSDYLRKYTIWVDKYFNPRSPCGERHRRRVAHHAGDEFQSTLPVRGATLPQRAPLRHMGISIHAPRAGSDSSTISSMSVRSYFNPRSPCGERRFADGTFEFWRTISIHAPRAGSDQERMDTRVVPLPFQSTLPVRGAT